MFKKDVTSRPSRRRILSRPFWAHFSGNDLDLLTFWSCNPNSSRLSPKLQSLTKFSRLVYERSIVFISYQEVKVSEYEPAENIW